MTHTWSLKGLKNMIKPEQSAPDSPISSMRDSLPIDGEPPKAKPVEAAAASTIDQKADDLSNAIHSKFMALLSEKLAAKGGHLSASDVTEMGEEFRRNMDVIKTMFVEAVDSFNRAQKRSREENERGSAFTRLMVHKFEHQFVEDRKLKDNPYGLSRRMLPGFMNALHTMVGAQKQADYEKQASEIIHKVGKDSNGDVDWEKVYATPGARMISLGAEIELAQHFKKSDKRIDWLLAMVNSNLIPLDDGLPGSDWKFTRAGANQVLRAIFSSLKTTLDDKTIRAKIIKKLGQDAMDVLDAVAERFQ